MTANTIDDQERESHIAASRAELTARARKVMDTCPHCSRLSPGERDDRVDEILADIDRVRRRGRQKIAPELWPLGRRPTAGNTARIPRAPERRRA